MKRPARNVQNIHDAKSVPEIEKRSISNSNVDASQSTTGGVSQHVEKHNETNENDVVKRPARNAGPEVEKRPISNSNVDKSQANSSTGGVSKHIKRTEYVYEIDCKRVVGHVNVAELVIFFFLKMCYISLTFTFI